MRNLPPEAIAYAMRLAVEVARLQLGGTYPNPAVGAAALDENGDVITDGKWIALAAHVKPGTPHAEALLIEQLRERGLLGKVHTLAVTLEPCNHTSANKKQPCSHAVHKSGIPNVVYAIRDPNPVAVGGAQYLKDRQVNVQMLPDGEVKELARQLVLPFLHSVVAKRPLITVKQAINRQGNMFPPFVRIGKRLKTFTSTFSRIFAHQMRKSADALLTTAETIMADNPNLYPWIPPVKDHPHEPKLGKDGKPGRKRTLFVMDRSGKLPHRTYEVFTNGKFDVHVIRSFDEMIEISNRLSIRHILVEAGPRLLEAIQAANLWDLWVTVQQGPKGTEDKISHRWNKNAIIPVDEDTFHLRNILADDPTHPSLLEQSANAARPVPRQRIFGRLKRH